MDALVERLREFVQLNYMTAAQLARQIGVHDSTVYAWLLGQARPVEPKRLVAFLDAFSRENGSGIALQSATNIANTRIGVGSQSRAVARFVSRRRGRFERSAAGF